MSTTTAPAELEVPREFLLVFVSAANLGVMGGAEEINSDLSLDYTDEGRRQDDAKIASLREAIEGRAVVLRAVDDDGFLPIALVQRYVSDAIGKLRSDLDYLTNGDAVAVAEVACTIRDLIAWATKHGLAIDTAKAGA